MTHVKVLEVTFNLGLDKPRNLNIWFWTLNMQKSTVDPGYEIYQISSVSLRKCDIDNNSFILFKPTFKRRVYINWFIHSPINSMLLKHHARSSAFFFKIYVAIERAGRTRYLMENYD